MINLRVMMASQKSFMKPSGKKLKLLCPIHRQGDPISGYFFILVLEIVFTLIKTNNNIEGLNIFNHNFLYIAYADDTTFFVKNINSATEIIKTIDYFSLFSGFEINKTKCKIAGSGVLKGIKLALCGMKCVNLNDDVIKILE